MIRKNIIILLVVLLSLGFTVSGCSKTAKKIDNKALKKEFKNAPEWVLEGNVKGMLSAVGSAKIGKGGIQFARTEAVAQARDELSRRLSVKVKALVNNFMQQTGMGDDQLVDNFSKQVSKQVTAETLSGSWQKDTWISPSSEYYALVVLEAAPVKKSVKNQIMSSYQKDEAKWNEFKAANANQELDKEIEKTFGGDE